MAHKSPTGTSNKTTLKHDKGLSTARKLLKTSIKNATSELENKLERNGWFIIFPDRDDPNSIDYEKPPSAKLVLRALHVWRKRVTNAGITGYGQIVQTGRDSSEAKREVSKILKKWPSGKVLRKIVAERSDVEPADFPSDHHLTNIDQQIAGAVESACLQDLAKVERNQPVSNTMPSRDKQLLHPTEVMKLLGVSLRQVYAMNSRKTLRSKLVWQGRAKITRKSIDEVNAEIKRNLEER